ncbi:MAG: acyl carrier protein [Firmicutes bacterium]|nr:acyl carrier protein [Bacillota bacterium]
MDSLTYIRFIMAVELEFGFEFDEEDYGLFRFSSIGDLNEYIRQRILSVASLGL